MMVAPERDVPGMSANACAMPILRASLQRIWSMLSIFTVARIAALSPLRPENHQGADDECRCDRNRREEVGLDHAAKREPENRRGQKGDDEIDHEALRRAIGEEAGRDADELAPKFPADGEDGACLITISNSFALSPV